MILAIDAGNSRIKAAVFNNEVMIADFVLSKTAVRSRIISLLQDYPAVSDVIVASVGESGPVEFSGFERVTTHFIRHNDNFPFTNLYSTPATLGIDRMVLAAGAVLSFPGQCRLVIDAGTCVTYDFIDERDNYHGGAISPGLRLRYESLHNFTAKLPLLTVEEPADFIGSSTSQAIHSGVVNGLLYEIDGFIAQYRTIYPKFTIILTGGDAEFLAKRLKNTIFANSNFLLESLNHFFQYTNQK